ncbi:MAG TPA: glycine cleavage system protein H, partial [Crenotrichaceae bacterium]|nr:glycine cleavage system protein H [Crenotrichaceae bacterium]
VFLELPEPGIEVIAGKPCATIESVKTASDINSPVSGVVLECNEKAIDEPETINETAYETWLFKVKANNPAELDRLLTIDAYQAMIKDE